ncbi:MAG TPA: beta-propeller domain-containing protein [Candidatus Acidoferrum sp.]|nr:beta-propeller domain-containing protein [Candidatus Acidoferrum sp.]
MLKRIASPLLLLALLTSVIAACDGGDNRPPWHGSKTVALVQYQTCDQLESDIKARALQELDAIIDSYWQYRGGGDTTGGGDGAVPPSAPGAGEGAGGDDGPRQEGTDYSGTNNQEDGVDEADLVKTDGYNIYVVNANHLHIFGVPEFGQLIPSSTTELEGSPYNLLLDGERGLLAVFSFVAPDTLPVDHPLRAEVARSDSSDLIPYRTWALSKITILDVSDPTAPALDGEVWLEGWIQTARRTDHSVRVVINGNILVPGLDDLWNDFYDRNGNPVDLDVVRERASARIAAATIDDLMPRLYQRLPDGEVIGHTLAGPGCHSFFRPTDSAGRGTTTILSFELGVPELAFDADTVVSNWSTVYASRDRLYLAESAWDWWWSWSQVEPGQLFVPSTNIHAFDVTAPGQAAYLGSGRIEGNVSNQFALDEEAGLLRVAATTTAWRAWREDGDNQPPPPPVSHIDVLEEQGGSLATVGQLSGLAPGESIFAARFLPDEAFLVTYRYVDPLITVDLSDPRQPAVLGELEVPGFSTYLHPIAGDRLLSIGVGGDENGADWNTQVSLFDVSDRAHPALVDADELVSEGYGWSEAMYEHKAFQYFAPEKLLAVPLSSWTYSPGPIEGDVDGWTWHTRLELLQVDSQTGITRRGAVDHSRFFTTDGWWGLADVRRSIFMGDFIYAVSARAITVNRLDDLSEVAALELPLPSVPYWWW